MQSIVDILREYGIYVRANGVLFCPFHNNVHTPSAKVYDNKIYCFFEKRFYTVYDFLKLQGMSDEDIERFYGRVDGFFRSSYDVKRSRELVEFVKGHDLFYSGGDLLDFLKKLRVLYYEFNS